MKRLRIGNTSFDIVGSSESDRYFDAIADGIHHDFNQVCAALLTDPAGVALDVGANIGTTAAILSQHLPHGKIYAFEPGPNNFAALETNISANRLGNVEPINLAVAAKSGLVKFFENSAYGYMTSDGSGRDVASVSIDEFVTSKALKRVDFIKIDIEGFEKDALEGARETIEKFAPTIHMEFNLWCLLAYSKNDPIAFAEYLLHEFRFIFAIDALSPQCVRRIEAGEAGPLVHDRLLARGCIDDLVLTNDKRIADIMERLVIMPSAAEIASIEQSGTIGWRKIATYARRRIALHARTLLGGRGAKAP